MRRINLIGCIFGATLGGCALHPVPDDVSPYSTEMIVHYGRCEMRAAIIDYINNSFGHQFTGAEIGKLIKDTKKKKNLHEKEKQLLRLADVAAVYSFDFHITENNKAGANAGFRLPGLTSVVDVGATAALDLTRQGQRVFGTEDTWEELILAKRLKCPDFSFPQSLPGNFIYPLTGSIGVYRVVGTFINIEDQGGAKDHFVDTLTFTTQASGGADAAIKLDPVPNQFRLVSATAAGSASRLDIHKLTLSLAFPQPDPPNPTAGVKRTDGDILAPFTRPAPWRARYNLCVADARTRENTFRILRLEAPEVYCIRYADAFAPTATPPSPAEVLQVQVQGVGPRALITPPAAGAPTAGAPTAAPPATSAPSLRRDRPAFAPSPRSLVPQRRIRPDSVL